MAENPNFIQFFVKLFDNKTLTLQLPINETLTPQSIKYNIQTLSQIPTQSLTLALNGKSLNNNGTTPIPAKSLSLSTIYLTPPLFGGKGGFGSLLRGAATKAGQKKTNNFDACRDMSGRRLRHVNAEKRLEEWKAEEEERRLEKVAEKYLKAMVKEGKGGRREDRAEKYVEKYREVSAKCVEEVERSVRESVAALASGGGKKRKLLEKLKGKDKEVDAKKLKIWMGKRKLGESDTDTDSDESKDDGSDAENEKSVVIDNGIQSDSSKDASSSSASVPQRQAGVTSYSGSEEEKETVTGGNTESSVDPIGSNNLMNRKDLVMDTSSDAEEKTNQIKKPSVLAQEVSTVSKAVVERVPSEPEPEPRGIVVAGQLPSTANLKVQCEEADRAPECQSASPVEKVTGSSNASDVLRPVNFDDFNSAVEMEVLGLERLKSELQVRRLKCGGTLQERAARLFLLKTTPFDKLPKKLLAKK